MYAGMAVALLVANLMPTLQRTYQIGSETTAVLIAGGIICLLGVLDDRWELDSLTKLAGQVFAAGDHGAARGAAADALRALRRGRHAVVRPQRLGRPDRGALPAHHQRDQLHRRAGRARRRGVRDLRAGLLRLLLPPGPGGVRRRRLRADAAVRGAGRGVPRLPAAQLLPGPGVHGRLRLDADRADAGGGGDRPRPPAPTRRASAARSAPSRCTCRSCCRWWCSRCPWSTWCWRCCAGSRPAARRSRRTRCTCTTGCWRSATRTAARCCSSTSGPRCSPSAGWRCPSWSDPLAGAVGGRRAGRGGAAAVQRAPAAGVPAAVVTVPPPARPPDPPAEPAPAPRPGGAVPSTAPWDLGHLRDGLVATAVLAAVGVPAAWLLRDGRAAAWVAVGLAIVAAFFCLGALAVAAAGKLDDGLTLPVALGTYRSRSCCSARSWSRYAASRGWTGRRSGCPCWSGRWSGPECTPSGVDVEGLLRRSGTAICSGRPRAGGLIGRSDGYRTAAMTEGRRPPDPTGATQGWAALGTLLAGICVWGGIGWLVDLWLGTDVRQGDRGDRRSGGVDLLRHRPVREVRGETG